MAQSNVKAELWVSKFKSMYVESESEPGKRDLLIALIRLFCFLAEDQGFESLYPDFGVLFPKLARDMEYGDPDLVEVDLTQLYCYIHRNDSNYTQTERETFDAYGGYWCHPGGLSPLFRARPYIHSETRIADYGAGNGLQGLLFQYLYPHRKTCQIELSAQMIESGRKLQGLMQIPQDRVEWIHENIIDVPPTSFDFIYLYRPVRPEGTGRAFYEKFCRELDSVQHHVTVFSIADCLKDFLGDRFRVVFNDGHLTCFSNE